MRKLLVLLTCLTTAGLFLSTGCGDDSPSDPGDPVDDPTSEEFDLVTVESSLDDLATTDELYRQIMADQGVDAANAAALALFENNPAVAASGVSEDSTVWARFNNGLLVAVYEIDRNPSGLAPIPSIAPSVRSDGDNNKGGGEAVGAAVVMTPFAHDWGNASETQVVDLLDNCFGSAEVRTQLYSDEEVSVNKFGDVLSSGPGVLLYSSHGCIVPRDATSHWVALMTGESYSTTQQLANALVNLYITGASAADAERHFVVVVHKGRFYIAVTPAFIAAHANFDGMEGLSNGCKSVVYACCCYSGHFNSHLQEPFLAAGVDKYFGWSKSVKVDFAADAHLRFFRQATDTCTIIEAYNTMGISTDPASGARLNFFQGAAMEPMMIRSQMSFDKDGGHQYGYSVGVAVGNATMVNCFAGQPMQPPSWGLTVQFPAAGEGTFSCVGQDGALILITDFSTGEFHVVQQGFVGVDGEIEVSKYDDDVVAGTFNGTLGHWDYGSDPEVDPPASTISISNGVFKHIGERH